jgi:hypothetical protein
MKKKYTQPDIVTNVASNLAIEFLDDLSKHLREGFKGKLTEDLIYLVFWCSKKNIQKKLKLSQINNQPNLVGRGLVLHFPAINIPTNFVFSFIFGLLSGNSNVVFYPDKIIASNKIVKIILTLFKKKKYENLKRLNKFLKFSDKSKYLKSYSMNCNARLIWGGDSKIDYIKSFKTSTRNIDFIFGDRYSISIINFEKLKYKNLKTLCEKFYLDNYIFNQNACSSSHIIYWLGSKKFTQLKIIEQFWQTLNSYLKKKIDSQKLENLLKYEKLNRLFLENNFLNYKNYSHLLEVIDLGTNYKAERLRGFDGIFFQKKIKNFNDILPDITNKLQTISVFGVNKKKLANNLQFKTTGVDRIVDIGDSLNISFIWDGIDILYSLTRKIQK